MVPYRTTLMTRTSYSPYDGTTSTTTGSRDDNPDGDCLVIACTQISKVEDLHLLFLKEEKQKSLLLLREKPEFDRVMKMRNTDGRPVKYSTWKPARMYNGRDNIGTRNFKKVN